MKIDTDINLKDNDGVRSKKEYESSSRCLELQSKITNANNKCAQLELDIGKKISEIKLLNCKLGFMERDKKKGESEIEVWELKCKDLEIQVLELEKRMSAGMIKTNSNVPEVKAARSSIVRIEARNNANEDKDVSGTPPINMPLKQYADSGEVKGENNCESRSKIRKRLDFDGLQRERKDKIKWKNVWDMFDDFDRRPELCMKAVCALYRRQTPQERSLKKTIDRNGRGFNCDDARRGSELAEFLTGGDPNSNVKKSVEELKEFNPNGVALCREYTTHYPNQLFEIYKNEEDPFFP
ncbi:hypothetical protein BUALT_Bualt06G0094900 [Buddleja alternifolia]|uniref:Uncharacterized protein n=1 Tax=Buddleja alternifolia TaxID=168488 RepID=A0AAV6XFA8_9LAMI|nr:hypothetical protein BUALT_Bualt06G0094900 [Buddleja alternifolia]